MTNNPVNNELRGVSITCERGGKILFENLEFSLVNGQGMIIQGQNGTGKTSLLRIITGLSQAASGEVLWNLRNIETIADQYQQQLLYIGHLPAVKRELTVRENLKLLMRFWPGDAHCTIAQLAEYVGLRQRLSVTCSQLSAGQQRRVSLARLFISSQKLWVLDEPLTALDTHFIARIEECLQNHLKNGGMLVLTTHRGIDLGGQVSDVLSLDGYKP